MLDLSIYLTYKSVDEKAPVNYDDSTTRIMFLGNFQLKPFEQIAKGLNTEYVRYRNFSMMKRLMRNCM